MNCPHCQKPLPEKHDATFCLHCGQALELPEPAIEPQPQQSTPVKFNWLVFLGVLLTPSILTLVSAFLGHKQSEEQLSPGIAFFGSVASGLLCGMILSRRLGGNIWSRIGIAVLLAIPLGIVSIGLSCVGCMVGGYKFEIR